MRKALLFILNELGGAEKVTLAISRMLLEEGWIVEMCSICIDGNSDTIKNRYMDGVKAYTIHYTGQIGFMRDLWSVVHVSKPDVVFCSAMHVNQRLLLLSNLFPKTKFIVRNDNHLATLPHFKRMTMRITYKMADHVICQSSEMAMEIEKIGINRDRIIAINNPLDKEEIDRLASGVNPYIIQGAEAPGLRTVIFVAVGRVDRQKGFDNLIQAFAEVKGKIREAMLYIVGETEGRHKQLYDKLLWQIKKLGLSDCVRFAGFQENPYTYIANADVFVLSSRFEGLPNVLIESQMLGVPCAATRCVPVVERIMEEGVTGFMAEPDDPESLAAAMIKAVSLKKIESRYRPGSSAEFVGVFNRVMEQK